MKDLEELYSEAARRSKIHPRKLERSANAMWELLAEQPLHMQYRLINEALDHQQAVNPNAISKRSEPKPPRTMHKSRAADLGRSVEIVADNARKRWYWYLSPTSWFR